MSEDKDEPVDLTAFELEQLLGLFIGLLSAKAWQYMGIRITPGKDEPEKEKREKDLMRASISIDCLDCLVEKLTKTMSHEEAEKIKAMVADLKINYARQV